MFKQLIIDGKTNIGDTLTETSTNGFTTEKGKQIKLYSRFNKQNLNTIKISYDNVENISLKDCKTGSDVIEKILKQLETNAESEKEISALYKKYVGHGIELETIKHQPQNNFAIYNSRNFATKIRTLLENNNQYISNIKWEDNIKNPYGIPNVSSTTKSKFPIPTINTNTKKVSIPPIEMLNNNFQKKEITIGKDKFLQFQIPEINTTNIDTKILSIGILNELQKKEITVVKNKFVQDRSFVKDVFDYEKTKYLNFPNTGKYLAVSFLLENKNYPKENDEDCLKKQYDRYFDFFIERILKSDLQIQRDFYTTVQKFLKEEKKILSEIRSDNNKYFFEHMKNGLKKVFDSIKTNTLHIQKNKENIPKIQEESKLKIQKNDELKNQNKNNFKIRTTNINPNTNHNNHRKLKPTYKLISNQHDKK